MPYNLENRLVVGLASSALFNLETSDQVFREQGEEKYRMYQLEHQNDPLGPGVAFQFIRRLLSLNELDPDDPPVEVVLLSRNDPDTGLRVMNSIKHHGLEITRALFLQGGSPYKYIPSFDICLFLSANEEDVSQAIQAGYPAGKVLDSTFGEDLLDNELRIAFDFDGVLVDDEAETVYQRTGDLEKFHRHEQEKVGIPHNPGPLKVFFEKVSNLQKREEKLREENPGYKPKLRISIVTARNAPSHERVINTMRTWGITVNELFFLGGVEKRRVLEVLKPHIFFDDQKRHLETASALLPSVHVPFGIVNRH